MVDQLVVLGVLMLTSKGSAGVTGSGFITLAATLASMGKIPVSGMVLLIGVDRFMSEARAITNTIGNGVGALVVGRWVGAVDSVRMQRVLDGEEIEHEIDTDASVEGVREDVAVQFVKPHNASA
jgi:aerobic C4-dicarboxylate transport protein